ncbi:hypothetical protein QTP23_32030, partial [Klebsiella michiganensis]|nr:hypothetical protein [Klebsiella michiganensis]
NQRMTGSNARWKWTTDYNRRSIAETAMYRVKQLFGGSLTLRDYDGQVAEAMALVRALGNDSNLLIVFYVQIVPDDFVMQLHRF